MNIFSKIHEMPMLKFILKDAKKIADLPVIVGVSRVSIKG